MIAPSVAASGAVTSSGIEMASAEAVSTRLFLDPAAAAGSSEVSWRKIARGRRAREQFIHSLDALGHHPRNVGAVLGGQFEPADAVAVRPEAPGE